MIREAEISDLPEVIRMGREFAKSIGIPLDDESTLDSAENLINTDFGVLLIGDGSMAGALAYPLFFNKNILIAQELMWWVDREKRGTGAGMEILEALEAWARNVGAKQLSMLAIHDTSPDYVDSVYIKNGYKPFEKSFVKVL